MTETSRALHVLCTHWWISISANSREVTSSKNCIVLRFMVYNSPMKLHARLRDLLLQAGLSEVAVAVYLELLDQPTQTRWALIRRTGFGRNQVYRAFEELDAHNMVQRDDCLLRAHTLKGLVAQLNHANRKRGKLADKIQKVAPYLYLPNESVDDFEVLFTRPQIIENYMLMSEVKYDTWLDFGDLEAFVEGLGGIDALFQFRDKRHKQSAKNLALCTTVGPYTSCMARKSDMEKFQSQITHLNMDYFGRWLVFSDTNDYVLFNDMTDRENPSSVLIKSRVVADSQRVMFEHFSQNFEN